MIELGKKYKARDGRDVRIYAVDGGGLYPVHGAVSKGSEWVTRSWRDNGRFDHASERGEDLVEVLPEVTVRREVLFWDYDGGGVITGRPGDAGPGDIVLGTIAITHNGKEITDVKVVK